MTTPKDSKVDDTNTNQADSMKEIIATQHQLNQLTAQFIANNSDKDPALQRFLEEQSQLMLKVTNQMISMEESYPKGVYDNKDDKNVILDGAPACIICGDKDHTSKEHEGQCPNCEEEHPIGQCPTSQATCYLCEGNNHVPSQCPIFSIVEQRKRDGVQKQITDYYEQPKKKKKVDKSQVQCKHCKEMGHYSSGCPENQKYKEIGQVWCNNCKKLGHYAATCPQETREELKLITCFNCKEQGHYASNCPEKMKNNINKPVKDLSLVTCAKCGNKGHHADICPEKFPQDPKQSNM